MGELGGAHEARAWWRPAVHHYTVSAWQKTNQTIKIIYSHEWHPKEKETKRKDIWSLLKILMKRNIQKLRSVNSVNKKRPRVIGSQFELIKLNEILILWQSYKFQRVRCITNESKRGRRNVSKQKSELKSHVAKSFKFENVKTDIRSRTVRLKVKLAGRLTGNCGKVTQPVSNQPINKKREKREKKRHATTQNRRKKKRQKAKKFREEWQHCLGWRWLTLGWIVIL